MSERIMGYVVTISKDRKSFTIKDPHTGDSATTHFDKYDTPDYDSVEMMMHDFPAAYIPDMGKHDGMMSEFRAMCEHAGGVWVKSHRRNGDRVKGYCRKSEYR